MLNVILAGSLVASHAVACSARPRVDVAVSASHTAPRITRDLTASQLRAMAIAMAAPLRHAPLGAYLGRLVYKAIIRVDANSPGGCPQEVHLHVQMHLDERLSIARDLPDHGCSSAVIRHYDRHAQANEKVFVRYVNVVRSALIAAGPSIPAREELSPQRYDSLLGAWVGTRIERALNGYDTDGKAASASVDSAPSVQALKAACGMAD